MQASRNFIAAITLALCATTSQAQTVNWDKVDAALGRKAAVTGDVHRYGFPRTDLNVTLDGVTIKPALALGGWVAFKPMQGDVMVMGDLVLTEAEITPVLTTFVHNGFDITAIHNHVLRANPATFYFFFNEEARTISSDLMTTVLVILISAMPCKWLIRFLATISPISIPG